MTTAARAALDPGGRGRSPGFLAPWRVAGVLLAAYVATYAALSSTGRYPTGDQKFIFVGPGLVLSERAWLINGTWVRTLEPPGSITPYGYNEDHGLPSRVLRAVFLPLIAVDRAWIHRPLCNSTHIIE